MRLFLYSIHIPTRLKNLIRIIIPAVFAMLFFAACSPKTAVTNVIYPGKDSVPDKVAKKVKSNDTVPQTEYFIPFSFTVKTGNSPFPL